MGKSKRRLFLNEYFKCGCNATEAARRAGYKHPNTQGPRLKKELQTEIDTRLDKLAIPANEVLARLGAVARSDISEFIDDTGKIDFAKVKAKGSLVKRVVHQKGSKSTIELHDALAALMHLDKHHGGEDGKAIENRLVIEVTGGYRNDSASSTP